MKLVMCENGHFYNGEIHSTCPICKPVEEDRPATTVRLVQTPPIPAFCWGCMRVIQGPVCEHCGHGNTEQSDLSALFVGTRLHDRYTVGRQTDYRESIYNHYCCNCYYGWDHKFQCRVQILEFFPVGSKRTGPDPEVTLPEGENIQAAIQVFRHTGRQRDPGMIPGIEFPVDYFEENGTCYLVFEWPKGISLMDRLRQGTGSLDLSEVMELLKGILRSLEPMHRLGQIHGALSLESVFCLDNGTILLRDPGDMDRKLSDGLRFDQYEDGPIQIDPLRPLEVYTSRRRWGAYTDVYSICAIVFSCLVGKPPHDCVTRMGEGEDVIWQSLAAAGVPKKQAAVICKGMEVFPEKRFQSLKELEDAFLKDWPVSPKRGI